MASCLAADKKESCRDMLAAQDRGDFRRPIRIGPIVECQCDPSTRRWLGGNESRAPGAQNRPAMGKRRPRARNPGRTYAARADRVGRNPFEQDRDSRNYKAERDQSPVRRNPYPGERVHVTASSSSSFARALPRSFRATPWRTSSSSFARALSMTGSSSSARALPRSFRATRWRSSSSSSARARSHSYRAIRSHLLAPADQSFQPTPRTPWPTPPDGDRKRRAAEAAAASRAQGALAKAVGRVRTEYPRPGSSRAHPARSPGTRPETTRTRSDRLVDTSEHAFPLDPRGPVNHRRRPSFQGPSAQRSFAI